MPLTDLSKIKKMQLGKPDEGLEPESEKYNFLNIQL